MSKVHAVVVRSTCRSKHVKNTACSDHFWTFNWQKWSETFSLSISNSKCASHHFLNIWTSKSAPTLRCFVHFDFDMCFALQRRALFEHQLPKMPRTWSALCIFTSKCAWRHNGMRFFISHPTRWLCPWRLCPLQRAYFSTLRSHKTLEKKQYFTTFLLFRAPWSSLFWLFLFSDFFSSDYFSSLPLPTSASSVHVVGSLTSFSDLTCTMFSCFLPKCCCRVALCDFQFYLRFSWLISAVVRFWRQMCLWVFQRHWAQMAKPSKLLCVFEISSRPTGHSTLERNRFDRKLLWASSHKGSKKWREVHLAGRPSVLAPPQCSDLKEPRAARLAHGKNMQKPIGFCNVLYATRGLCKLTWNGTHEERKSTSHRTVQPRPSFGAGHLRRALCFKQMRNTHKAAPVAREGVQRKK